MTRYVFEQLAVMFGAATGALAASGRQIDLFGVVVLGLVAAMGGGTIRDLVLNLPVFWVQDAWFVLSGTMAAVLTFFACRYVKPPQSTLQLADAVALAFVTMLGTAKTWQAGHAATVCAVLGVVTGVAGGMLRDILCGEVPLVFRAHINLYATAALVGAVVYLLATQGGLLPPWNLLVGASVILGLRLAAIRWQLRLPVFMMRE